MGFERAPIPSSCMLKRVQKSTNVYCDKAAEMHVPTYDRTWKSLSRKYFEVFHIKIRCRRRRSWNSSRRSRVLTVP